MLPDCSVNHVPGLYLGAVSLALLLTLRPSVGAQE